jgi:two-component system sensor histidine kinase AlgZ
VAAIVVAVVLRHLYVQGQWRRRLELEALARIQALHSRIRPHFLFNSMNTIASLTRSDPALAERVVEDLAELFRVTLGDARVPARLAEELEVCRRYAAIEQLRLGERLRIVWDLSDAPGDALLPALTLQPLLENAIYHGIEPAPQGGDVVLAVRREAPGVAVTLSNPLCSPGMHGHRDGNRLALDNVRERLLAFFGPGAALDVGPAGGRYWVTLRFPYRRP